MKQSTTLAIGLDGYRKGWIAACLRGPKSNAAEWQTDLLTLSSIEEIQEVAELASGSAVAIDIPIGLPDIVAYRRCDLEAKARLTGAASTVFCPPPRPFLGAGSYADVQALVADAQALDPSAKGLSQQSFALIPKVREVDQWLREDPERNDRVFECHPELAFRRLNGELPLASKHSAAGAVGRLNLISATFADAREALAHFAPPGAGLSDALDAYAALSVATRKMEGVAEELSDGETDTSGLPMRIVN